MSGFREANVPPTGLATERQICCLPAARAVGRLPRSPDRLGCFICFLNIAPRDSQSRTAGRGGRGVMGWQGGKWVPGKKEKQEAGSKIQKHKCRTREKTKGLAHKILCCIKHSTTKILQGRSPLSQNNCMKTRIYLKPCKPNAGPTGR